MAGVLVRAGGRAVSRRASPPPGSCAGCSRSQTPSWARRRRTQDGGQLVARRRRIVLARGRGGGADRAGAAAVAPGTDVLRSEPAGARAGLVHRRRLPPVDAVHGDVVLQAPASVLRPRAPARSARSTWSTTARRRCRALVRYSGRVPALFEERLYLPLRVRSRSGAPGVFDCSRAGASRSTCST